MNAYEILLSPETEADIRVPHQRCRSQGLLGDRRSSIIFRPEQQEAIDKTKPQLD